MSVERSRPDPTRWTPARVMLGRVGSGLPLAEMLRFQLAHARARDAVHLPLDAGALATTLKERFGAEVTELRSRAVDRHQYLVNPDLGRRLRAEDHEKVDHRSPDLAIVIADGLSSRALGHVAPLLDQLLPLFGGTGIDTALFVATQARVAIGDEIGALAGADLVLVLIGERPGLSSPDSLGAYLTFAPRIGCSDAERNCVSNIRPGGLGYLQAAARLSWLVEAARTKGRTGVTLKDESQCSAAIGALPKPPPALHGSAATASLPGDNHVAPSLQPEE
ncbi:ethanolamine ammonia-lyase subunit EutC [Aureimonas populi]|uniref:Ethanolamine ammonia-lyase small subunit n=1 Tax=Aureimonas populi TaxID=1701758 RepID=A0ABW5CLV7_9HYPH|nr:ethanolamine ammonia-lyase subunit EutC [Aureimonas populi]